MNMFDLTVCQDSHNSTTKIYMSRRKSLLSRKYLNKFFSLGQLHDFIKIVFGKFPDLLLFRFSKQPILSFSHNVGIVNWTAGI